MLRSMEHKKIVIVCVKKNRHASFRGCVPFYYMLPLNHLDSLFTFSSIYHDFLEDDGWVVRSQREGVDAIG